MSDEDTALSRSELLEMAADIVRAYVSHNDVKADNLPSLIPLSAGKENGTWKKSVVNVRCF